MNTNESNLELIEELLKCPERNFARLLFETPPLMVIEILAELVLHPDNGHDSTVQCLYVWQDLQANPYTLSSILEEIQNTRQVDIVCACLTLVNRLLQHAPDSLKRIRIRRELEEIQFEQHLLAVSKCLVPNEQLKSLVEKFTFLLHQPSASTLITRVPTIADVHYGADADSGTFSSEEDDVMNGTADDAHSNGVVETAKQSGDITNEINSLISTFDSSDDLELLAKLLKQLQVAKQPSSSILKQLNENFSKFSESPSTSRPSSIPPPPPLLSSNKNGKIPAPPSQPSTSNGPPKPPPLLRSGAPIPPPPILGQASSTSNNNKQAKVEVPHALKPKFVPPDGKKLRHLQWTKIPINNLASNASDQSSSNVWLKMGNLNVDLLKSLDFAQLDSYFACEPIANDTQSISGNEKESKSLTVSLLCGKRSLSVNVFLKSLKGMTDDLIAYIKTGQSNSPSASFIQMLVPLLPTEEEVQTLNNYTGNRAELGIAECFLLELLVVSDYKLRIESIILREEFGAFISTIEPDLRTIIKACQELRQSRNLQTILLILLHMGNYLNHNAALGNAVGFKLSSLWKIDELRAIKGGRTLLHLIAQQAEKANANLDDISHVEDAAKLAFESLKSEVKTSVERVNRLENQLKSKTDTFFNDIKTFLSESKQSLERSNDLLTQIESERQQLAVYFCENEKTFSLEECFKILNNFRNRFIIASNENRQREEREKRAQEKNASVSIGTADQLASIKRNNLSPSELIKSPDVNRRTSVIVEQDRDRTAASILQSVRRKSSATRKDSAILDKFNFEPAEKDTQSNNDLCSFMDQALELNSRRRASRFSPLNPPLSKVQEFRETTNTFNENKEMDEVKVSVPTINSQTDKRAINENTKPVDNTLINKMTSTVPSASLVNSVMEKKTLNEAKESPPLSRANKTSSTNGPSYNRTTLRNVPAPLQKPVQPSNELDDKSGVSSPYRKQAISRIRARQSNEPTQKPQQPMTPIQPLRPSQVRMAQTSNRSALTTQSSTTSNSSSTNRLSNINSTRQANKVDPKPVSTVSTLRKSATPIRSSTNNSSIKSTVTPTSRPSSTVNKEPTNSRTTMSASEKRSLFRQNTSLSTTSRPTLIRCGSKTEKPRWS